MIDQFLAVFQNEVMSVVLSYVVLFSPIWMPIVLATIFWMIWVNYVRALFFLKQSYIVLEIKLPKETFKSPQAMELFLVTLHQTGGESTWYDKYWLGKTRPWFSLEMVSIEGQVKFFIWTRASWRPVIESGLYAQFPSIEIFDAPDYTKSLYFDPKETNLWGCDYKLTKPDPYPIKTYIDYGLDKDPKEEFKIDPITNLIEFLGTIGQNQQVWIQIILRAHKDESIKPGHLFKKTDKWKDQAKEEIEKIRKEATQTYKDKDGNEQQGFPNPTKGQTDTIAALERSISKLGFDVGMRSLYIAKRDSFNPTNISGMTGSFKQFSSGMLNGFAPTNWSTDFSYPWQDFMEIRQNKMRKELLGAYRRRSYFFPPVVGKPIILNTEELATVYHFPGQVSQTPSFTRIVSKKGEAPANLPI